MGGNVKKPTKNSLEGKQVTNLFLFKTKQKGGGVKLISLESKHVTKIV